MIIPSARLELLAIAENCHAQAAELVNMKQASRTLESLGQQLADIAERLQNDDLLKENERLHAALAYQSTTAGEMAWRL